MDATLGMSVVGAVSTAMVSVVEGFWFPGATVVGVEEPRPGAPAASRLFQNQPNPFRAGTSLAFDVAGANTNGQVARLEIFDVQGRLVRTLVRGHFTPGRHLVPWDGNDNALRRAPAGVYLGRLLVGSQPLMIRLVRVD